MFPLFRIYRAPEANLYRFNAGFYLGLAVLCNIYYAGFLLLIIIGVGVLDTLSLRAFLQLVVAALLPIFLWGVGSYLLDDLPGFLQIQWGGYGRLVLVNEAVWNLGGLVVLSVVLGFVVFKQNSNVKLLHIEGRKKVNILYWWLLLGGLLLFYQPQADVAAVQTALLPLGFLLSLSFNRGNSATAEAGHFLLLVAATLLNIYPLLVA